MRFDEYHICPEVKEGITALGFKRPTDIQYKCIPPIIRGDDLLAVAQTGTGKTAAFAIPVINMVYEKKRSARRVDGVKCIVMTPTHELAMQITGVFKDLARYTNVEVLGIYGGVSQDPQIEALEKRVDILIATPGRMFDLISQQHLRVHRVEILVLDEADHMLDLGFINDIRDLTKKLPIRRQTLFFSATINEQIKKVAYSLIHQNAICIQVSPHNPVSKNITHSVAFIEMDDKRFFLERLVRDYPEKKILVFVRTKVRAERVSKAMERVNVPTLTIHSDKDQYERTEVMNQFKRGDVKILIATDVSARGIDIPNVDFVVNYDLPDKAENYVHRVGRTGRGTQKGKAVSFCSPEEKEMLKAIETYTGHPITVEDIPTEEYDYTMLFTEDPAQDLQKLMNEIAEIEKNKKKKKKSPPK